MESARKGQPGSRPSDLYSVLARPSEAGPVEERVSGSLVRIPIGWIAAAAGLAVAVLPAVARAQNALGGGNNLQRDFNRYGGSAFQRTGPGNNAINNAIIYGNAPGGMSFQGRAYGNPYEFQGRLGTNQISRFERDSYFSRAPSFGVNASQIANYQRAMLTGGRNAPGIGGNLAVPRNPYTAQSGLAPSLGYKTATQAYKPAQTTMSAAGGLFGIDPFGRTRTGMQRDVGLTDFDAGTGVRKVTPGGLGGERNLMRDLTTQMSSGLTRQAPVRGGPSAGVDNLPNSPLSGGYLPGQRNGSTASEAANPGGRGAMPGAGSGLRDDTSATPSPFGPGIRTGLNTAMKAGKGYEKSVLAQARNAEGWRQTQTATGLTGVQVRTQAPAGLRPTLAPDRDAASPAQDNIVKMPGLALERIDTSAQPRTAYELLRDRITQRSEATKGARADGSDLLTYTLGKREAGGLTGLNEKDVLGLPTSALANPALRGMNAPEFTALPGIDTEGLPEWERRVQELRDRLRQQAILDNAKDYYSAARDNQEETTIGGVRVPNYIQPVPGPTVNLWGKTDRPLPGLTPQRDSAKVAKGYLKGLRLDTTTLKLIRESGGKIETFINTGAPATDQFKDFMTLGQGAMKEGRYFDAEEAFARAMNEPSADITALVGRTHAQIGAGLIVSAAANLTKTLIEYPETAAPRYAPELLPREARLLTLCEQLRGYFAEDNDLARSAGLLLAYIGYQRGDQAAVRDGLDAMARVGKAQMARLAPGADRDLLEDEGRLVEFLRGVWQSP